MGCPSEGETGPIEDAGEPSDESFDAWRVTTGALWLARECDELCTEDFRGEVVIFERREAEKGGEAARGDRIWVDGEGEGD